jgi:pimeloyl-ACP methyl ester carboxylesterase
MQQLFTSFRCLLLAGLATGISCSKPQLPTPTVTNFGANDSAGNYINTRGCKLYFETYGQGEPLLLIHGNGGSIVHMENQIKYFANTHRVIVADSRAHGRSIDASDSLSYEQMSDDFAALLDSLNIQKCSVFGWSDGGINGLLLAMRHPSKVEKLAITGANLVPDTTAVHPFIHRWARSLNDSIDQLPQTPENRTQRKIAHLLSYAPNVKTIQLGAIQCPTLVIAGDHDVIRNHHTVEIAEAIPNSYLWIIPNSGHSTPIYKKDQINVQLDSFFTQPYRQIKELDRMN